MSDEKVFDNDKTFGIAGNIIEAIQFCEREIANPPNPGDDAHVKAWKNGSINAAMIILRTLRPDSSMLAEDTIHDVKRIRMLAEHLQSALHCADNTLDGIEGFEVDVSDVEGCLSNIEDAISDARGALGDLDIEGPDISELKSGAKTADGDFDELIELANRILGD